MADAQSKWLIQIVGLANGEPTPAEGCYVQSYSPDGNEGRGDLVLSARIELAHRYDEPLDAMSDWGRVSTTHPRRRDGKPNRPMTAFTIELCRVDG